MEKESFKGVFAAALTPLLTDLSCNYEALAEHCTNLIDRGCKGIVLLGTTGEGPSFSIEERCEMVRKVIDKGIDSQKIIVAIITTSLTDAQLLAKTALNCKCAAILAMPPTYFRNVSEEGVIEYYRQTLKPIAGSDLKVILYHFPALSGVPITPSIIKTLQADFPQNVIGLKDSGGDLEYTLAILKAFPELKVFVGKESDIPRAVLSGAAGSISGIANLYPELICALYEQGRDLSKQDSLQTLERISAVLHQYPLFPAIKACLANLKGHPWILMRPPLMQLNQEQRQNLLSKISASTDKSR